MLNPQWKDEILEPQAPHIGFFTSSEKRKQLEEEYQLALQIYTIIVLRQIINNAIMYVSKYIYV